jgi:class 3 adenylate cyclase
VKTLGDLLADVAERTSEKLSHEPKVELKDNSFDPATLPIDVATWHYLSDVVAVVFDMKGSTQLEKGRSAASTASIYDAGVGSVVRLLREFSTDFVDIQGDGGFGLFWGERRYERAMCAAVTIRSYSDEFTNQIERKWKDAPSTGFKVAVSSSSIMAKRVGIPRHLDFQEPVWAGHAVNYATKAAQQTDPKNLVVTAGVWDQIQTNDFLSFSCGCDGSGNPSNLSLLWTDVELDKIPDEERFGESISSPWCQVHGEQFCAAIMAGEKYRKDIPENLRSERNLRGSYSPTLVSLARQRRETRRRFATDTSIVRARGSER